MTYHEFIDYVENKITPYVLNESGKANMAELFRRYPENFLLECIDIGIASYFRYDGDNKVTHESVSNFLQKLPGIAYNKSRSPLQQEVNRLLNKAKRALTYWNDRRAMELMKDYLHALRENGYDDTQIIEYLRSDVEYLANHVGSWTHWRTQMEEWIEELNQEPEDEAFELILPETLMENMPPHIQAVAGQINISYNNNLLDCCAVMMRHLLRNLLIELFQVNEVAEEIMDSATTKYKDLPQIIECAKNNTTFILSASVKRDIHLFDEFGDFDTHHMWHCYTQQDIHPYISKYRIIIEELLYKSGNAAE